MEAQIAAEEIKRFGRGLEGEDLGRRVFLLHVERKQADVGSGVDDEWFFGEVGDVVAVFIEDLFVDELCFFLAGGVAGGVRELHELDGHDCGVLMNS